MKLHLKICGMKHNTAEVAKLQPDYLGFIFYEGSKRNFEGIISEVPENIKRVGVFVDATIDKISEKIETHQLEVIQLHGEESPEYCTQLRTQLNKLNKLDSYRVEEPALSEVEEPVLSGVEVWKVFSIKDTFNFRLLEPYEASVDKFLFDTKGKDKGGNGYTFNWNVLSNYNSTKPFVLSGGIGLDELDNLKTILKTKLPIHAIDVNSKFEIKPGLKNTADLKKLQDEL